MPKRVTPRERRDGQILVRVTDDQLEWLDAAAFLGRSTRNQYVFDLVAAHVEALHDNRAVASAVDLRAEHDEAEDGVAQLPRRRT